MEFFMVRHYIYDGCGRADMDDVIPCSTFEKGMNYLKDLYRDLEDYDWQEDTDVVDWKILVHKGPGEYGYDYYYIESMTMDEEI